MTTEQPTTEPYGDAITAPFWDGARRHELLVQRCLRCATHQFYPRPFCLSCDGDDLEWIRTAGTGSVYSITEVQVQVIEGLQPPYQVAVVELDEGPRLTTNVIGGPAAIGDRVQVGWRERSDAPPCPIFAPLSSNGERS